ncbi:MAG TPA: DoxX family protein [Phytomonospora sp.]
MNVAYNIVTVAAALWVAFSAFSLFRRAPWVVEPLGEYGVPRSWWTPLALAKAAGAVGLIAGLFFWPLGLAAAIGLVLYFSGAVITIARARSWSHIAYPLLYMIPVIVAVGLGLGAGAIG